MTGFNNEPLTAEKLEATLRELKKSQGGVPVKFVVGSAYYFKQWMQEYHRFEIFDHLAELSYEFQKYDGLPVYEDVSIGPRNWVAFDCDGKVTQSGEFSLAAFNTLTSPLPE